MSRDREESIAAEQKIQDYAAGNAGVCNQVGDDESFVDGAVLEYVVVHVEREKVSDNGREVPETAAETESDEEERNC